MENRLIIQNPFRAREKEDDEKRLYENVSREFTPLPYHLRYKTLYVFSVIGVWFILALSGITEFSAVYAFMYGLISQLPFGSQLTLLITGFLIIGFELLHRFAGNTYFKEFWLDGGKHQSDNNGALAGLILCAAVSLGTSIPGGFDLVENIKKKPRKIEIEEEKPENVAAVLSPYVQEAQNRVQEYKSTRSWKGKLSDKDAKEWKRRTEVAEQREQDLIAAITNVPKSNEEKRALAEQQYKKDLAKWQRETSGNGTAFGVISILTTLLMYLCIWFQFKYKKKTQEHLTEKYLVNNPQSAAPPASTPQPVASPSPTPSSAPDVTQVLLAINHRLENLEKTSSFHSITPAAPYPTAVPPAQGPHNRPLIGFKLPANRSSPQEAETPLQAVAMPCNEVIRQIEQEGESLDPADTPLDDIYTVEHRRFTDGKVIRHGKERIRWYVSKYADQVTRAQLKLQEDPLQEGLQDSLTNFQEKLAYWKSLEEQLKAKLKTAGIQA